jgi:hypothetical protein
VPRDDRLPAALLGALVPAALAFADGGYFPQEWGLAALLLLLAAATALLLRDRLAVDRLAFAPAAALALLGLWQLLTLGWSPGPTEPVHEAERTLVYLALALAAPLVVSRGSAPWLAGGAVAGVTAVSGWALATRLGPGRLEPFDPGQLAEPIGYWNAQAILAVLGLLLALGLVALPSTAVRAAASAAMPLLAATLALTFSRGSWLAFAAGLGVLALVATQRRRLAALAVPGLVTGALAAAAAGSLDGLTREDATLQAARDDGRRLALVLLLLAAAAALGAVVAARVERRWTPGAATRRAWTIGLAGAGAAVVLAGLVRLGDPLEVVDAFTAPLPTASGDLGDRLASASGNGRADYWRAAWREVEDRPLGGGGAGSWERWWLLERPTAFAARDAHNLYLEALAELGPLGLLLLLAALAPPLLVLPRGRAAAAAGAAYAAFLLHAALDWDWEIPAVTATALLAGQAVLATSRSAPERPLSTRARALGLAALLPLAVAAGVAHAGNRAAAEVEAAIARDDPPAAVAAARRAERYAPWSTEALRLAGEARLAAGQRAAARPPLREALARDPGDWELWYVLSFALDGAAADEAWERARALNPRAPELAVPRSGGTPQDRS